MDGTTFSVVWPILGLRTVEDKTSRKLAPKQRLLIIGIAPDCVIIEPQSTWGAAAYRGSAIHG